MATLGPENTGSIWPGILDHSPASQCVHLSRMLAVAIPISAFAAVISSASPLCLSEPRGHLVFTAFLIFPKQAADLLASPEDA